VVTAVLLIVLGLVYGVGFLVFAWWDGGLMRRILMMLCGFIVLYGLIVFLREHPFTG